MLFVEQDLAVRGLEGRLRTALEEERTRFREEEARLQAALAQRPLVEEQLRTELSAQCDEFRARLDLRANDLALSWQRLRGWWLGSDRT
jgi:hypothetical protein